MSAPIEYTGQLWNPERPVSAAITTAAEDAKQYGLALVKAKTPVRTGNLKDKWDANVVAGGIQWKNQAPYAGYVELGTKYMQGREMLTSSLPAIEQVFQQSIARNVGERLGARILTTNAEPSYTNIQGNTPLKTPGFVQRLSDRFAAILSGGK